LLLRSLSSASLSAAPAAFFACFFPAFPLPAFSSLASFLSALTRLSLSRSFSLSPLTSADLPGVAGGPPLAGDYPITGATVQAENRSATSSPSVRFILIDNPSSFSNGSEAIP
jgi:hypothetical protein